MNNKFIIIFFLIIILVIFFIIDYNTTDNFDNNTDIRKYTILCHIDDYLFIKDYINNIFANNKLILYNNLSDVIDDNVDYLCIRRPPKFVDNYIEPTIFIENTNHIYACDDGPIFSKKRQLGFLNLDQLVSSLDYKIIMKYMNPLLDYYDYSLDNLNIVGKGKYLPYIENTSETLRLQKFLNVNKKYDVVICGNKSDRRDRKIQELIHKGISVIYLYNIFSDDRDKQIGECKILLNIHNEDDLIIYESLRCERWRFANMPIISEYCISKLPDGIIGCTYDDIYITIVKLLKIL